VKGLPLLAAPPTVTTTFPVVAPVGTATLILVALQRVNVVATVPLNFTVLVPWLDAKFVPVIVTTVAIGPDIGDKLVIVGVGRTVKLTPLLTTPPTVTTTLPVVAVDGTVAVMLVALQFVNTVAVPLPNFTTLVPWVDPKPLPAMITLLRAAPEVGDRLVMLTIVKFTPLLAAPPTVTTTLPVVAPLGTVALILVALQRVNVVAAIPLNFTVLVPWVDPKFVPVIVTTVPIVPEVGAKVVIVGVGGTVKVTPLLATPPTVTTTVPVAALEGTVAVMLVALQFVNTVAAPLPNVTVLVPWLDPNPLPAMITLLPAAPDVGDKLVMLTMVKFTPLVSTPLAWTTTFPVVAPVGTVTLMLVALQRLNVVAAVPLNFTVLVPCVDPKFVPVIVTTVPMVPDAGDKLVIVGVRRTVNVTPLLATPPTVTTTVPVAALEGTVAVMLVALQFVNNVAAPLPNVTVLVPWLDPNPLPAMITLLPAAPDAGDKLVMLTMVKFTPLVSTPLAWTTTFPVVAPVGTVTLMLVALQRLNVVAAVPLNFTVLVPCVDPKFVPVIVTTVPMVPEVGDKLVIVGVGRTVNVTPLLGTPPTVTTTLPVIAVDGTVAVMLVALQAVIVVAVPLPNFTVLVPWVEPKPLPAMITLLPAAPEVGDRLAILTMVKFTPLLATPPTVTTTLPVVAPLGTVALMLVALQRVNVVAAIPLNFTVLVPWVDPKPVPVIVTTVPMVPDVGDKLVIDGAANAATEIDRNKAETTASRKFFI